MQTRLDQVSIASPSQDTFSSNLTKTGLSHKCALCSIEKDGYTAELVLENFKSVLSRVYFLRRHQELTTVKVTWTNAHVQH
jgi:hypothetical protein